MITCVGFKEKGIEPAPEILGNGFKIRRLTMADAALDHEAVMASREFLYHWEQNPPYPPEDFSVSDNEGDIRKMYSAHEEGSRYTYTVVNADETQILGCVYLIPSDDPMYSTAEVTTWDGTDLSTVDGTVSFWVRPSTWHQGFEGVILRVILNWLRNDWVFNRAVILTNEALTHQIETIESLSLSRRFSYDRPKDMYRSHAYA